MDKKKQLSWDEAFEIAKRYYLHHGNLNLQKDFKDESGFSLGSWLSHQREYYQAKSLSKDKIDRLKSLNFDFAPYDTSWSKQFELLKQIYDSKKTILPYAKLPSTEDFNLFNFVYKQLQNYRKEKLTNEKISLLESVGIIWNYKEARWYDMFYRAKELYESQGKPKIIKRPSYEKDKELHIWISKQISNYNHGRNDSFLNEERIKLLESIGFCWSELDEKWEQYYLKLKKYYLANGNIDISRNYSDSSLANWLIRQRQLYKDNKLNNERIDKLNKLKIVWDVSQRGRNVSFPEKAVFYYLSYFFNDIQENNRDLLEGKEIDIFLPSLKLGIEYDGYFSHKNKYEDDNNKDKKARKIGLKMIHIRESGLKKLYEANSTTIFRNDSNPEGLNDAIKSLLKSINISFDKDFVDCTRDSVEISNLTNNYNKQFEIMFYEAKKYYKTYGTLMYVTMDYKTENGRLLYSWLATLRHNKNYLTHEQISELNSIGMVWNPSDEKWNKYFEEAKKYYEKNGNLLLERGAIINGLKIGDWIHSQRNKRINSKISDDRIKQLDSIGMIWNKHDFIWTQNYLIAKEYFKKNKNLLIKRNEVIDGVRIGVWIGTQRKNYRLGLLSKTRVELLNNLNMTWKMDSGKYKRNK